MIGSCSEQCMKLWGYFVFALWFDQTRMNLSLCESALFVILNRILARFVDLCCGGLSITCSMYISRV